MASLSQTCFLDGFGGVPAHRVRRFPFPGTAVEADAVRACAKEIPCELVHGTLIEKVHGPLDGFLVSLVTQFVLGYALKNRLGITTGPRCVYRMINGNIRVPDFAFTRRERLPSPLPEVGSWCPNLCVEIVCSENTAEEMAHKRADFFGSGCRLVWEIDPQSRDVMVYTTPELASVITQSDTLDGRDVLPGFALPLAHLFEAFDSPFATANS
jgi:Uma2 family endonuclease